MVRVTFRVSLLRRRIDDILLEVEKKCPAKCLSRVLLEIDFVRFVLEIDWSG